MPVGKGKSGASVDVEGFHIDMEGRLKALEAEVSALKAQAHDKCDGGGTSDTAALEQVKNEIFEARQGLAGYDALNAKIDDLTSRLSRKISF